MPSEKTQELRRIGARPTFETDVENIHPAFGWALVREIDLGRTPAGIIVPEVSRVGTGPDGKPMVIDSGGAKHHELIATSKGCCRVGLFCEAEMKPGDRVVMCSGATRASMNHFPKGVFLVMLEQVIAYERAPVN